MIAFTVSLRISHHVNASCVALGAHCSHIGHSSCATKALLPAVPGRERRGNHPEVQTHATADSQPHSHPTHRFCSGDTQHRGPSFPTLTKEHCGYECTSSALSFCSWLFHSFKLRQEFAEKVSLFHIFPLNIKSETVHPYSHLF